MKMKTTKSSLSHNHETYNRTNKNFIIETIYSFTENMAKRWLDMK